MRLQQWIGVLGLLTLTGLAGPAAGQDEGRKRAADRQVARGEVARVQAGGKEFAVKTRDGKEMTFRVDGETRLRLRGESDRLSDLKAGTPVRVRYVAEGGSNRAVTVVANPVTAGELRREVQDVLDVVKKYTFQQKGEYEDKLEAALADLEALIDDLRDRGRKAAGETKERLGREVEELEKKRAVVEERLEKVRQATPGAWEEIKGGAQEAVEDLRKAVERARKRFE